MTTLPQAVRLTPSAPLGGRLRLPGDKSISHRALLLGALAEGTSCIRGLSSGHDVGRTAAAVEQLGAAVVRPEPGMVEVRGGRRRWHAPPGPIDCGNSGTTLRLLAGVVATCPWTTVLTGDRSLRRRPMDRVAEPLAAMGASVEGQGDRLTPPLRVHGGALRGITWTPPVASAQVKSAILLAGLAAEGPTVLQEPVATRAHTEEMLAQAGADITVEAWGEGRRITLRPCELRPLALDVPGDPSQAAFWVVAATLVPGSAVHLDHLYPGPERLGFLDVLVRMGAHLERRMEQGTLSLSVSAAPLRATTVRAEEIPSLDEVPALALAAAAAQGTTAFVSMGELRVKESDRLEAVAKLVRAFGARAEVRGDDLLVTGTGGRLSGAQVDSGGDHRIAMAACVGALGATGATTVTDFSVVATSYPQFLEHLTEVAGRSWGPLRWGPDRRPCLIAIDGPAGSGKSTVTAALSERLGIPRLDTGAMYRALTWEVLRLKVDPHDPATVAELARRVAISVESSPEGTAVFVDGAPVTDQIRLPQVSRAVSAVAAHPEVRTHLVELQRRWVRQHPASVVEGRDIASVVLPDADLKVYLTAAPEERARRRHEEGHALARRDHLDSNRQASPLRLAPGARVIDSTDRSVDQVVEEIVSWL